MAEVNLDASGSVSSGQTAWDRAKARAKLKRAPGVALQNVIAGGLGVEEHNAAILRAGGELASDVERPLDLSTTTPSQIVAQVPAAEQVAVKPRKTRQAKQQPVVAPILTTFHAAIRAEGWGMSLPVVACDRQDDTVAIVLPKGHSFSPAAGTNMHIECPGRFVGNVFYPGTHANISTIGAEVIMMLATD